MRKLMWFTMGYAIACGVGAYLLRGRGLLFLALICGALAAAGWFFRRYDAVKRAMVLVLGCAVGFLSFFGYEYVVLRPAAIMDGKTTEVTIRVTEYSWQSNYGIAADGVLELEGRTYKVRFYLNEERELAPGDVVRLRAQLRLTDEGGDREPTFHRTSGILLLAYPRGDAELLPPESHKLRDLPAHWAEHLKGIIDSTFPEDTFAFAKALLLGDKSDLSWQRSREFSISGISHIVALQSLS